MEIEQKVENNLIIIKPLSKNIDSSIGINFKGKILDLINQGNYRIALNLSEVNFIDSSGLGVLISILKTLTNNKGAFVMYGVKEEIVKLFSITRLDRVFRIYLNEEEAIQALSIQVTKH